MKITKRVLVASALSLATLGGLAACSSGESGPAAPRATETPPTVIESNMIQTTATVTGVDPNRRVVNLRGTDGRTVPVRVGQDVNLGKIEAGDVVDIAYYESVAVNVAAPGEAVPGVTGASETARSQPGDQPGRATVDQVTVTSTVIAIDHAAHTVSVRGPQGNTRTVTVKNPQLREKMKGLKVGDLVQLTYTEALAARIQPRP